MGLVYAQNKIMQVIVTEAKELAKKYGQERRTTFADADVSDIATPEELIQEERCLIIMSAAGNIKRVKDTAFMRQACIFPGFFTPSAVSSHAEGVKRGTVHSILQYAACGHRDPESHHSESVLERALLSACILLCQLTLFPAATRFQVWRDSIIMVHSLALAESDPLALSDSSCVCRSEVAVERPAASFVMRTLSAMFSPPCLTTTLFSLPKMVPATPCERLMSQSVLDQRMG